MQKRRVEIQHCRINGSNYLWIVKQDGEYTAHTSQLAAVFRIKSPSVHNRYSQEELKAAFERGYFGMEREETTMIIKELRTLKLGTEFTRGNGGATLTVRHHDHATNETLCISYIPALTAAILPFETLVQVEEKWARVDGEAGLNNLTAEIYKNAVEKGWWDTPPSFPEIIALCHSELSGALEFYRSHGDYPHGTYIPASKTLRPEGVDIKLADCIMRILDYCGHAGIDIEAAIHRKHEYNKTRKHRHGGKRI